ncbi:RNA-metabolising metallo-beta-lactamase family protein [Actinidia rufa]|uniref:RNA-metabolising metallo-beta-lactamase family protein n=1 Tax=Actinidia rufa TaxID=165716 RepID=A0A7J0FYP0_9ERIC|nr:RNA-metabolising metallo-beta-lactamase family protein [Actinidia rufa]
MVRKYSSKRPEVIAIAIENPAAVLSEELNTRLSCKSSVGFGTSALRKVVDGQPKMRQPNGIQEEEGSGKVHSVNNTQQKFEERGIEDEILLSEEATTSGSESAESFSTDSEDSDDFWKSFVASSPIDQLVKDGNGSVPQEEHGEKLKQEIKVDDSVGMSKSELKSSKSATRNKWKPEEVKKLIIIRGALHSKFLVVKRRMALWEEISANLLADGVNRSPGQCKSLWTSLVQKYEESKSDKKSKRSWPYFEDMNKILSDMEAIATK